MESPGFSLFKGKIKIKVDAKQYRLPNFSFGQPESLPVPVSLHPGPLLSQWCPMLDQSHWFVSPSSIPGVACKALLTKAHAIKHEGGVLRFPKQQFRCFLPFQNLPLKSYPVQRRDFCTQQHACSFSICWIRDYCFLEMVPCCHQILLLVEKVVCCSLKKNKSLTLYKTCAVVAPLTPCESVWVGK